MQIDKNNYTVILLKCSTEFVIRIGKLVLYIFKDNAIICFVSTRRYLRKLMKWQSLGKIVIKFPRAGRCYDYIAYSISGKT